MDYNSQQLFETELKTSKVLYEAKLVTGEAPSRESEIDLSDIDRTRFLSFYKLLRVTGQVLCFINTCRLNKRSCNTGSIITLEIEQAKLLWDKYVQNEHFQEVIQSVKKSSKNNLRHQLNLQLDSDGLLRCYGRLDNAELTQTAKRP